MTNGKVIDPRQATLIGQRERPLEIHLGITKERNVALFLNKAIKYAALTRQQARMLAGSLVEAADKAEAIGQAMAEETAQDEKGERSDDG